MNQHSKVDAISSTRDRLYTYMTEVLVQPFVSTNGESGRDRLEAH